MKKLDWKKIALISGVIVAFITLLGITALALYLAYQYKMNLEATHTQLVAVSRELADVQKCIEYINSGKLLPTLVEKGNEFILTYECK